MPTRGLATSCRTQGMSLSSQLLCPSLEPARDGVLMIPSEPQGRESLGLQVRTCTLPRFLYFQGWAGLWGLPGSQFFVLLQKFCPRNESKHAVHLIPHEGAA